MEEPPEEATGRPLEPESTARSPNDSHRDRQKDNRKKLDKKEADNQSYQRTANQANPRVYSQAEPNIFGQADYKVSEPNGRRTSDQADLRASNHDNVADHTTTNQTDQGMSEQMGRKASHQADHVESEQTDNQMPALYEQRTPEHIDRRLSGQAERRTSEQIDRRLSSQAARRTSDQIDRRMSSQAERRTSDQVDRRMSSQAERRTSDQVDRRMSGQADQRTSEQMDSRLSGLVERKTFEQVDKILPQQTVYKTSVKTHHKVHDQVTELAEHKVADPADSSTHHPRVDKHDYSESDEVDHIMNEEDNIKDNLFDYGKSDHQYDDRIFTSKKDKEADFKVEPYKFNVSQTDLSDSKVLDVTDSETTNFLQAFNSLETKIIGHLQAKSRDYSPRFPTISTQLDYTVSQDKSQDISEYQERRSSHAHKKAHRKRFPSIVYQDPYQVSLQYMEKHHILQIFQQITENLVYERPEDPLSFMLYQVQEMIKNRDNPETYKE
ncbi:testis expressed 55 [Phyllostomus discolor]|uniref:Testis expressed 55 n=1 Tax=Phyllostomus discolor TaxID=89673 RepID=A0A834B2Q2_9CHIR|nr:testis expressed 55 [Phyllostomus discolor]